MHSFMIFWHSFSVWHDRQTDGIEDTSSYRSWHWRFQVIALFLLLAVCFRDIACNQLAYVSVVLRNRYKFLGSSARFAKVSEGSWHQDYCMGNFHLHSNISPCKSDPFAALMVMYKRHSAFGICCTDGKSHQNACIMLAAKVKRIQTIMFPSLGSHLLLHHFFLDRCKLSFPPPHIWCEEHPS